MSTPLMSPAPPGDPKTLSASDAQRRRGLRRMRSLALALLVLAAVIFAVTRDHDGWLGYVNAGAEAAMVGAIADWFAVTALFRHPLGLPIPHTAIIPHRKQALGESLQEFVTENFLAEDVIRERLAAGQVSKRFGAWLLADGQSTRIVRVGSRILSDGLASVKAADVSAVVEEALIPRLKEEELSAVTGQLMEEVLREQAHRGLVDLVLIELHRWVSHNGAEISALIEERAPWWTPQWLDTRIASRMHGEALSWIAEIQENSEHNARQSLDRWLNAVAHDLQYDPATMDRAERMKIRILEQPQVGRTSVALWDAMRRALIGSLGDPEGLLRQRITEEVEALGERLCDGGEFNDRVESTLSDVAAYVVNNYGQEIAGIISATVNRWDGKETAERIELHVGRDLQFIRINGTVVGGLAGLVIHTVATIL